MRHIYVFETRINQGEKKSEDRSPLELQEIVLCSMNFDGHPFRPVCIGCLFASFPQDSLLKKTCTSN